MHFVHSHSLFLPPLPITATYSSSQLGFLSLFVLFFKGLNEFSLFIMFSLIYFLVHVCLHVHACVLLQWCACGGQRTTCRDQFFSSTM